MMLVRAPEELRISLADAYQDCFILLCGRRAPFPFPEDMESLRDLPEDVYENLQWWARDHVLCRWMTGIGTLEAIDHMVQEALSNGNLSGVHGGLLFPKDTSMVFAPRPFDSWKCFARPAGNGGRECGHVNDHPFYGHGVGAAGIPPLCCEECGCTKLASDSRKWKAEQK